MAKAFEFDAESLKNLQSQGVTLVKKQVTEQDQAQADMLAALEKLGSKSVKDDSIRFENDSIVLPRQFQGNLPAAADFIMQIHEAEEEEFSFGRTFKFRPWDGAAAFNRALYKTFGTTGLGKAVQTMFGKRPPELVSIQVSPSETLQVPWGRVSMPPLNATFDLGGDYDEEYGALFRLNVTAPRKQRQALEGFFDVVQAELSTNSIYKGKAFNGADMPEFLDLSGIDESKVVYSDEVMAQLNANIWSVIEHTDTMKRLGIPLKRAVLVEGPYGTGKTLAGALTAQRAQKNGWTFILARPGKDNLFDVLNTAKLYAPAVVQFEDIDTLAKGGTDMQISRLLDALDGISNKTSGVVAMFTTNHVEELQKGVMRPGRIDSIIHIGALDRNGVEKLIRSVVKPEVLGDVDYDVVYSETEGFLPAFVKEAVDRAVRYAVSRNGGKTEFRIETEDIVLSAQGLRRQLDLMNGAKAGQENKGDIGGLITEAVESGVSKVVEERLNRAVITDYDGDFDGRIKLNS
jgi:ATPase family protein associated with various cellular activities (AAA)